MRLIALTEAEVRFTDGEYTYKKGGQVWLNPAHVVCFSESYNDQGVKWVHITMTTGSVNVCETFGEVLTIIQDF